MQRHEQKINVLSSLILICFTSCFISSNLLLLVIYSSSCGRTSPVTSPLQSPSSSPYASPISSETNSRAGSPWNSIAGPYFERNASNSVNDASVIDKVLVKEHIQEQWDTARKIEEVSIFPSSLMIHFLFVELNTLKSTIVQISEVFLTFFQVLLGLKSIIF